MLTAVRAGRKVLKRFPAVAPVPFPVAGKRGVDAERLTQLRALQTLGLQARPISTSLAPFADAEAEGKKAAGGAGQQEEEEKEAAGKAGEEEAAEEEEEAGREKPRAEASFSFSELFQALLLLAGGAAVVGFGGLQLYKMQTATLSSNAVRSAAFKIIDGNPDVANAFGQITNSFGQNDRWGEGRRNYVPEYTYKRGGVQYMRVTFMIENRNRQLAKVFAEMRADKRDELVYLIVQLPSGQCLVMRDNRVAEKPVAIRQQELAEKVLASGWVYYGEGVVSQSTTKQAHAFGEAWSLVPKVWCQDEPSRCDADQIEAPAWVESGRVRGGLQTLVQMERRLGLDVEDS